MGGRFFFLSNKNGVNFSMAARNVARHGIENSQAANSGARAAAWYSFRRGRRKFQPAYVYLPAVLLWNITTRDRQVEHEATRFCASDAYFPLTEISLLITLRRQIPGDREFGERTALPPRESRNTVSRDLPGTIETSRG